MIRKITAVLFALVALTVSGQNQSPITWADEVKMSSASEGTLILKAHLQPGWHLYGLEMPEFGPRATEINLSESEGVTFTSAPIPSRMPLEVHDTMFDLDLTWWDKDVEIVIPFTVDDSVESAVIKGTVQFMGCNDQTCSPPQTFKFEKTGLRYSGDEND